MCSEFCSERYACCGYCYCQRYERRWAGSQYTCKFAVNPLIVVTYVIARVLTGNSHGQIKDAVGNDYGRPRDVIGESRMAFTSHADSAFDVCFENVLTSSTFQPQHSDPPETIKAFLLT